MTPTLEAWKAAAPEFGQRSVSLETENGFCVVLWDSGTVGDDLEFAFPGATRDEAIDRAERWAAGKPPLHTTRNAPDSGNER